MKKLDVESVLKNIEQFLKDNLNAKIQELNLEKSDGIILKDIDPGAFIFQSLDEFPVNFNPVLYYGIESVETLAQYGATAKSMKIEISVILSDSYDRTLFSRLFRYQRAIEETFLDNYVTINNMREKVNVTSLEPIAFKVQNSSSEFKAIGVIIELNLFT